MFQHFYCCLFSQDLEALLGGKFSDDFITACLEEVDTSKKGKISYEDFLSLFEDYKRRPSSQGDVDEGLTRMRTEQDDPLAFLDEEMEDAFW